MTGIDARRTTNHEAVSEAHRSEFAGALSVSEAGIWPIDKRSLPMGSPESTPSSEGDKA